MLWRKTKRINGTYPKLRCIGLGDYNWGALRFLLCGLINFFLFNSFFIYGLEVRGWGACQARGLLLSLAFLEGYDFELGAVNNGGVGRPFKPTKGYVEFPIFGLLRQRSQRSNAYTEDTAWQRAWKVYLRSWWLKYTHIQHGNRPTKLRGASG
jgi:hypothetical protein